MSIAHNSAVRKHLVGKHIEYTVGGTENTRPEFSKCCKNCNPRLASLFQFQGLMFSIEKGLHLIGCNQNTIHIGGTSNMNTTVQLEEYTRCRYLQALEKQRTFSGDRGEPCYTNSGISQVFTIHTTSQDPESL